MFVPSTARDANRNVTILRTKRLTLRPVQPEDAPAFEAFYGDADVMSIRKYGVLDPAVARTQLREMLRHWRTHGFGMWVVTDAATGAFAGECGLRWLEDRTDVELSYGLYPRFRGRGLATEAARAIVDYGIDVLELGRIVALSRDDNTGSHRILENLGMNLEWRRPSEPHGLVKYVLLTRMYTSPDKVVGTDP